jgi:hypothetical protein
MQDIQPTTLGSNHRRNPTIMKQITRLYHTQTLEVQRTM